MIEGILGKKVGMTQVFTDDGMVIPVTVIEAGPCTVVCKRTKDKDGYSAVQLGYIPAKSKHLNKPLLGYFEKRSVPSFRVLREFPVVDDSFSEIEEGDEVRVDIFEKGDRVAVTGKSKGKGFQGAMKRHGFSGMCDSHGSRYHRAVGSIGQHTFPAKVFKGLKMAGQMGNKKVTVRGLEVVEVIPDKNLLLVKGSVPGPQNGLLVIKRMKGR